MQISSEEKKENCRAFHFPLTSKVLLFFTLYIPINFFHCGFTYECPFSFLQQLFKLLYIEVYSKLDIVL